MMDTFSQHSTLRPAKADDLPYLEVVRQAASFLWEISP